MQWDYRQAMKSVVILCAFGVAVGGLPSSVMATDQIPDEIVFDGKTSPLLGTPLSSLPLRFTHESLRWLSSWGSCSASWRGHKAFWRIHESRLFRDRVVLDPCSQKPPSADLSLIQKSYGTPISATWFTGVLILATGRRVRGSLFSNYDKHAVLVIQNGRVLSRTNLTGTLN